MDWTLLTFKRQLPERFGGQALLRARNDFLFRVKNIPLASPVTHTHGLWEVPGGTLCTEKGHSELASPPGSAQRGLFPRLGRQGDLEEAGRGGGGLPGETQRYETKSNSTVLLQAFAG